MILMLTYRCSLDCDHCMISKTGPMGDHMSQWVLESSMNVFKKLRLNTLGIAGGEPLEYPNFWEVLAEIRKKSLVSGFAVKVATSGEPIENDTTLIDRVAKMAPVIFQVTRTEVFYPKLACFKELVKLPNVYKNDLLRYYPSKKSKERNYIKPSFAFTKNRIFCEIAWWLKKRIPPSLNFGAFIRQWEGYGDMCSIHVHPDGAIRMGPLDICRKIGNVVMMDNDFRDEGRRAMVAIGEQPCRACGIKREVP